MNPRFLYPLFILLFTNIIFSQENIPQKITIHYKSGVLQSGTFNSELLEFDEIIFNPSETNKSIKVTPSQIEKFVDDNGNEVIKTYKSDSKTNFIKLLVGGDISLYYFIDENLDQHYISDSKEFGNKELIQTSEIKKIDSKSYTSVIKQYIGTMKVLFRDCTGLNIENTEFKLKSLSKAFEEYNTCKGNLNYSSSLQTEKPEIRLGILTGANFTKMKTRYQTLVEEFDSETGLTFGAEISYIPTFIESKITGVLGVFYTSKGGTAKSLRQNFESLKVDYEAIELSFSLRYNFFKPNKKINPFLGVGLNKGFLINDLDNRVVTIFENGEQKPYENYATSDTSNTFNLTPQFEGGVSFILNDSGGIIIKALYYNSRDKNEIFMAKGISLQAGYLIRF